MKLAVGEALQLAGRYVDNRLGLDTSSQLGVAELGHDSALLGGYEPSRWGLLTAALPRREVSNRDVLVDLGSGKGRVVLEAAHSYPFRRVTGVELSPQLTEVANRNLRLLTRPLRCTDVRFETADATHWVPPDDLTIVYMFNPFLGDVFSAAVARLVDLVDRRGRPLRIIYVNPVEHERLMATGRTREMPTPGGLRRRALGISPDWVRRYELIPST